MLALSAGKHHLALLVSIRLKNRFFFFFFFGYVFKSLQLSILNEVEAQSSNHADATIAYRFLQ